MLEKAGKIACGPDGNGHSLKSFVEQGIWEKWKAHGIDYINILPIDNPLADPFDTELVGFHARQENDVTLKAIFRHDPQEKMGVICLKNHKIGVQEYSELPADTARFELANTSLYCLSMEFIKTVSAKILPWHLARKTATVLASTAQGSTAETTKIWKCETFLFDILDHAKNVSVLVYPREQTYAPLKNNSGENSLATLQAALLALDQNIIRHLTGKQPPDYPFELAQDFHYPTATLLNSWQGKSLPPQDYIEDEI
jgi:UDP-N-acetylglucosamine/UDP-N-acetylgalactosamine diphosphorylase